MSEATDTPPVDENKLIAERREKLKALRGQGIAYPNDFRREDFAGRLQEEFADVEQWTAEALEGNGRQVKMAGRLMAKRIMGKASFAQIQDESGRIQLFLQGTVLGDAYTAFKGWDVGDIIAVEGGLTRTRTGELSVKAESIRLLTKSLRPLPDKWHGLADVEQRYRQRYVDLIVTPESRAVFIKRSKIIRAMRAWLDNRDFLEVETPMMHYIPGGAAAKPFTTHHNALDLDLYLRVAPELYLKRLTVGGLERVYEINRNFRNEGISVRHNPEFTMMEFYAAYWNYRDIMDYTEALVRDTATKAVGTLQLTYGGKPVDLAAPFERLTIPEAIVKYTDAGENVGNREWLTNALKKLGMKEDKDKLSTRSLASLQVLYFEEVVEEKLWNPTFIMEHPTEISPLARANDDRPEVTERFELYITGREFGNGFSELNDAEDQAARFNAQVDAKDGGDDEAMYFDHDFVRALEYGMPPTGGCGIGIDRFMMLLTDSASIRDIILFPALRREQNAG